MKDFHEFPKWYL